MDFICFAARLKCYYEGGVGLQKTLNHAGPSGKRPPGMSMPGDSDSDDDDDDDEEEEEEDEEEEIGEQAEEEEEQAAEDLRSDCHDTDASGLEAGAGPKVEAGSDGAAAAKAVIGDAYEETNGHAERALPDAARVDEDSAVSNTSGSGSDSDSDTKSRVNADNKNARVAETCDVDMGAGGVSPRAARNTDEEEAKPAPGFSPLAAAGDVPALCASAELSTDDASPKSGASRVAAQAMLDVITVSSVSAAISAAVQAVTTPDRAQAGKPAGPGSAPTE